MFWGINCVEDGFFVFFFLRWWRKVKGGLEWFYLFKKLGKYMKLGWRKLVKFGFVKNFKLFFKEDDFEKIKNIFY